jgi:hypothetical protein
MYRASLSSALLDNRVILMKIAAAAGVFGEFFVELVQKMADQLWFLPKYRDSIRNTSYFRNQNYDA